MAHFAIFDRAHGMLQWDGDYADAFSALAAWDAKVGIDPHGLGLDAVAEHYEIVEVTADQMTALTAWAAGGSKASQYPL